MMLIMLESVKHINTTNKQWILILDQDTEFPEDAVFHYLSGIELYPGKYLFCPKLLSKENIVSPCKIKFYRGVALRIMPKSGVFMLSFLKPINSGLLINLQAFNIIGGFNEHIKLDFSDFEFIDRFRIRYAEAVLLPIICKHSLSSFSIMPLNSAISRFGYYRSGIRLLKKDFTSAIIIEILLMLRAIKFSIRYKSLQFIFSLLEYGK
jgi:rhamnosyltransferase